MCVQLLYRRDDGVVQDGFQIVLWILSHHLRLWDRVKLRTGRARHVQNCSSGRRLAKDIGLLAEKHNGDDDSLSLDAFQVGLWHHAHRLAAAVLGENEHVAAQAHGARLEAVPVHPDGPLTGFTGTFFCETKAESKGQKQRKKKDFPVTMLETLAQLWVSFYDYALTPTLLNLHPSLSGNGNIFRCVYGGECLTWASYAVCWESCRSRYLWTLGKVDLLPPPRLSTSAWHTHLDLMHCLE